MMVPAVPLHAWPRREPVSLSTFIGSIFLAFLARCDDKLVKIDIVLLETMRDLTPDITQA